MTHSTPTNGDHPDESTRLLTHDGDSYSAPCQNKQRTPLPKAQLSILLAVRIVDPIAFSQIFPYINQLLSDLHIATPDQVGFYSGFIESAYSLAQMVSVYQWGRLSDIIGRRPVTMLSLVGIAITTIAFGLSTSLTSMLVSRFFGGLVAGNIAVLHSSLLEITDDSNQNSAIPIFSLGWSTGAIVGPLIGGTFANAAMRYPKYFSWPIFINQPYLPPSAISATCAFLGAFFGYFFMKETLPAKTKTSEGTCDYASPGLDVSSSENVTKPPSAKALLAIPPLRALTLSGLSLSVLSSAFDVVFTLFCYSSVDAGGLGLQPSSIGNLLAFASFIAVLLRLLAMPYILRRFDYATTYNTCAYLWPITFILLPLFNLLARGLHPALSEPSSKSTKTAAEVSIWIGLCLVLGLARVAAIPFSVTMLLIKRYAQDSTRAGSEMSSESRGSVLGKSNGLVQLAMCLGRTIGPILVSTLFTALNGSTWARRWGLGPAWAFIMAAFAVLGARVTDRVL